MLAPYLMAAMRCVDEGIAPETVDEAALAFGMPMGPIELADTVGLDICVAVGKMLAPDAPEPSKLKALVDAGHLGKKTKRGFYDWSSGKAAKQAPGAVPAGLADRLVGPFVAEAKAALAEHIVADADLVDAGAIFGTGFAPFRGGPLHYADKRRRRRPRRPARGLGLPVDRAPCDTRSRVGRGRLVYDFISDRVRSRAPRAGPHERAGRETRRAPPGRRDIVDRIWLKQYPKGVPADIDVTEYASVRDVFDESVAKYAARPAYTCMGKSITFAELDTLSAAFARMAAGEGCSKGTRVALMMPNILQYPICLFGDPARRLHGRERESALHGARARAPAERLRRRGDRRRRELRAHGAGGRRARPR